MENSTDPTPVIVGLLIMFFMFTMFAIFISNLTTRAKMDDNKYSMERKITDAKYEIFETIRRNSK